MRSVGLLPLILPLLLLPPPAGAQEKSPSSIQEFVRLLDDPDVRIWLQQAKTGGPATATPVETVTTKSTRSTKAKSFLCLFVASVI